MSHPPPSGPAGFEPVAEIRVRGCEYRGVFVAQTCRLGAEHVTATGRWCRKWGANFAEKEWGPPETFSWPWQELSRVKWASPEAAE